QRADHHCSGSTRVARGWLPPGSGRGAPRPQPADLWPGRHHPSFYRHQNHRRDRLIPEAGMNAQNVTVARATLVQHLRTAILMVVVLPLLLGIVYPLVMTGIAQVVFPAQANGSLVRDANGNVIGSALLGQNFTQPQYFHPRPSAAGSDGYDA